MMKKITNTAIITLVFAALVAVSAYAQTTFTFPESPTGILFGTEGTLNSLGQPTTQPGGTSTSTSGIYSPGSVYSSGITGSLYDPGILTNQYGGYGSLGQSGSGFTLPSTQFNIGNGTNPFGRNESTSPFTASPTRPFTPPPTSPFGGSSTRPFGGSSIGSFGMSSGF